MNENEDWKVIPYAVKYEVSSMGRVRTIKTQRILKTPMKKNKYCYAQLITNTGKPKTRLVHRLVMETHRKRENMDQFVVDHQNRVTDDNRLCNLRWATHAMNAANKTKKLCRRPHPKIDLDASAFELWRPVNTTHFPDGRNYSVSSLGRFCNPKGKIISGTLLSSEYITIQLNGKTTLAHRVVALSFLNNFNNFTIVNHRNGIKWDNRLINLHFCTPKQNSQHASTTGLLNHFTRKVVQKHQLTNERICLFESMTEAAILTKITKSSIHHCCTGISITAGGFRWEYADQPNFNHFVKPRRPVNQFDMQGKFLQSFKTIADAASKMALDQSSIAKVCNKKRDHCGGYKWQFVENDSNASILY